MHYSPKSKSDRLIIERSLYCEGVYLYRHTKDLTKSKIVRT
ncbi:MAG: hypothetical protein AAGE96_01035 [Cyanobacteria bacterium P01_G01_bin.19]